jgi:preprotein translocase subunit SecE
MIVTNERAFLYSLYGLGVVLWFVLWKFSTSILAQIPSLPRLGWISWDQLMAILAVGVAFAAVQMVWNNQKAKEYGVDVVVETKKVSWPNRKELQGSTIVVLVMVIVVCIIVYILDKIFDYLVTMLFQV